MTEQKQGRWATAVNAVLKFVQGYAPTLIPYIPSHITVPVDGSRYGSSAASLEALRSAEEFAIAVHALAQGVSSLEYKITDPGKNPIRDNHPLAVLIDQPNPITDWTNFIETCIYNLLPTGDCFILKDPMSMMGTPLALWILRSDRTRPIRGLQPNAPVDGFEHYAEDGTRYVFPPEAVIHVKLPNPFTPYRGLGITQLIPTTMAMDAASLAFNWMFFKQGGRMSTVIEMEKKMSPEAWQEFQRKIEAAFMGYQNAHRAIVLDDGAKLNTTAANASPKEVDFPETRRDISRVSGAIMGVTPIHMGHVGDANRSNSVVQDKIFSEQGVTPLAKRFARAITKGVAPGFGKFTFEFVIPQVEDPEVLTNRAQVGSNVGAYSPNDVRELWGDERDPDPNMDVRFLPFNMQPLAQIAADPELATPEADATATGLPLVKPIGDPNAPPVGDVAAGGSSKLPVPAKLARKSGDQNFPKGSAIQRRVLNYAMGKRPRTEKKMKAALKAWIKDMGAQVADALEESTPNQRSMDSMRKAVEGTPANLSATVLPILDGELQAFYGDLAGMFQVPDDQQTFGPLTGAFAAAKAKLATRVTGVAISVQEDIEAIVRAGMEQGLSPYEIANGTADGNFEGIRDAVDGMSQHRAQLIARTETVAMQDQASVAAYRDMGVTVVDVIGCEDFEIMPGQQYGCNSQGIPIGMAASIQFHPNHLGAIVPRIEKSVHIARALALR